MVNVKKAESKTSKPSVKKAAIVIKEDREKISAKANLKKSTPKKKVALRKDDEPDSKKKSTLGPKISKTKAGKKRNLSTLSEVSKKELPADSSEEDEGSYSDSSLDSEGENKILDGLKIKKGENAPTSTSTVGSIISGSLISQETEDRLKSIRKKPAKKGDEGVIYIGRLPNGFEETELKLFFEQFGKIKNLRLSRNRKTGASRHYAFVEFAHRKVAEIAAETMNNYLVSNRLLKCQLVPEDKFHPGMVSKYKVPLVSVIDQERHKRSQPKTDKQLKRINSRSLKVQNKLQVKLNALGIEYRFPCFSNEKAEIKTVELTESTPESTKALPKAKEADCVSEAAESLPKPKKVKTEAKTKRSA